MAREERMVVIDGDADSAQVAAFERDRRELVRRGLALGGTVVAASSIPLLLSVRNAFAAGEGDKSVLSEAIRLERIAVLVYAEAIGSDLLSPRLARLATLFRKHERAHGDALTSALTALRGKPPAQPTVKDIDSVVKGLGEASSQTALVNLAIELETATVAAYHDAMQKLFDARLLQAVAPIMANEGQHLVVLRQEVDKPPVPNALETGSR